MNSVSNSALLLWYERLGLVARRKTAKEWAGPCPLCGGRDRFVLLPAEGRNGRYWCRQCGGKGDVLQFLRDFHGYTFRQACRELGREPDDSPAPARRDRQQSMPDWRPRESQTPGGVWQRKAQALTAWAAKRLQEEPAVLDWLQRVRGLGPRSISRFRLGWMPEDMYRDRKAWGLPREMRADGKPKPLWLPQGLVIPVLDAEGLIARVKFRPTDGHGRPRYIPLPQAEPRNTSPLLINNGARAWQVVESELDAMLLDEAAGDMVNLVAMGSASYRPDAAAYARLMQASYVLLSLDYDEAGNRAACQWWLDRLPSTRRRLWPVPEGKDPGECRSLGWDLAEWVRAGLPPHLRP